MTQNTWHQVGPIWQRLYPSGNLGQCKPRTDGMWWAEITFLAGGTITQTHGGNGYPVPLDVAKVLLDSRYDQQPEHVLGGEANGYDWTFYAHGHERWAMARKTKDGRWYICTNLCIEIADYRAEAEQAARAYVMGGAQ